MKYLAPVLFVLALVAAGWWQIQRASDAPLISHAQVSKGDLGQLFMIGHWANTPVASTTALIRDYGFGGVIIMSAPGNPEDIASWVKEWNAASKVPLIIAIDQEGGSVMRLKGPQFIDTPQRDIENPAQAYEIGNKRGKELAALGITMNFAPVLDTAENPDSFLYDRVFSDPSQSATLASAMMDGMRAAGIIAVPKHFPGHDDTADDSHTTLPEVDITMAHLDPFIAPFRALFFLEQPRALMTAHVLFPKIDKVPATLSRFFLEGYLRNHLGYDGVIITDDMSMDAIDTQWTTEEATIQALYAGADLILFAAEPTRAIDALSAAERTYARDKKFRNHVDVSIRHIRGLRR